MHIHLGAGRLPCQQMDGFKDRFEFFFFSYDHWCCVLSTQRQAEEKAKKKLAQKRQEELDHKRKLEEEARKKKIQAVRPCSFDSVLLL